MTTLQALIDRCEADLADSSNATWSAADVQQWLRDAIADYALHFPRTRTTPITTTAGDHQYDLPADFLQALSVEYPTGEEPPQYLAPRPYTHPHFWQEAGYYDVVQRADDADGPELWIGQAPGANETITVTYHATHDHAIDTADPVTVPGHHHHVLRAYVYWQAALQLKAAEEANPTSNSSLLMSQLAANADRLRRAYVDLLSKALIPEGGKSAVIVWNQDRIY